VEAVVKHDVLDDFVSQARKDLRGKLKDRFTSQSLDRGQFVFFEGDEAAFLYLVESGVIEANVVHGDGKVYIFHFIFPADVFGEGVAYGQDYYPFSAVARKESQVWKVPGEDLLSVIDADPAFERYLLKLIGRKLDSSYVKARCIAGERVEKRVACILLKTLDQERGIYKDCAEKLDTPLTNRDISGLIGSTEETVSRVMSRLKKEGIIGTRDKQLVVLDHDALAGYFDSL
jgi:CRP/FNR family transcriptional regulator